MKRAVWPIPLTLLALVIPTQQTWAVGTGTRVAAATAAPALSPTAVPTPMPTATSSPTPTPIERCGHDLCLVVTPSPTPAVAGGTTPADHGPHCDVLDPGTWMPCLAAGGIGLVASWVDTLVRTAVVADVWTHTDPALTYANPVVVRYWDGIRLVGDAFLVLLVLGVALEILLYAGGGRTYAGALERFWRLLLVAALANGSLAVIAQAIDLSNLATAALDALQQGPLLGMAAQGGRDTANAMLLEAVLSLIDGVMELLLLLQMLVRVALLDVLIVLAAPALLCFAWSRLQHWASLWSRLFVATLITQFIQIAALRLGEDLALDAPLAVLPGDPTHVVGETALTDLRTWMQYLVSLGVFVVVLRVPRLLNNHVGHTVTPLALALWATRTFARGGGATAAATPTVTATAASAVTPVAATSAGPAALPAPLALPPAGGTTAAPSAGGAP